MSSIWTPSGEQPIEREAPGGAAPPSPEDDEQFAAEMAEVQRQLAEAPAPTVIANHAIGLFQLAALYLSQDPPKLADARLAIDALAAVVETLGDRLGDSEEPLRDALAQIRLAFVQVQEQDEAS